MIPYFKLIRKSHYSDLVKRLSSLEKLRTEEIAFIKTYIASDFTNHPQYNNIKGSEIVEQMKQLHQMIYRLVSDNREASWFDSGVAKFNNLLAQGGRNSDPNFYRSLTSELVKHLGANQGALYLVDNPNEVEYSIEEVAKYAYQRNKKAGAKLSKGEGLVGQCILDKDFIFMTDIPQFYTKITSGLGEATPTSLLLTPLIHDDCVVGVIELASFNVFTPKEIKFMTAVSKNIAIAVNNMKQSQKFIELYESSLQSQKDLMEQEEHIRQQMVELQATHETMIRKTEELEENRRLLEESNQEIQHMKEVEQMLIESKLEAQKTSYELIINRLKSKIQSQQVLN